MRWHKTIKLYPCTKSDNQHIMVQRPITIWHSRLTSCPLTTSVTVFSSPSAVWGWSSYCISKSVMCRVVEELSSQYSNTIHGEYLVREKLANLANHELFAKIFLTDIQIHRKCIWNMVAYLPSFSLPCMVCQNFPCKTFSMYGIQFTKCPPKGLSSLWLLCWRHFSLRGLWKLQCLLQPSTWFPLTSGLAMCWVTRMNVWQKERMRGVWWFWSLLCIYWELARCFILL